MTTYNGQPFPNTVALNTVIAAYSNPTDEETVKMYSLMIEHNMPLHPFLGYASTIDEGDVDGHFLDGRPIKEFCIGQPCFYLTNGFHRFRALRRMGYVEHEVEPDPSAFTNSKEREAYHAKFQFPSKRIRKQLRLGQGRAYRVEVYGARDPRGPDNIIEIWLDTDDELHIRVQKPQVRCYEFKRIYDEQGYVEIVQG